MKQFLINVRNLTASLFSWLVMVWLVFYTIFTKQDFELITLWQLFVLSCSWAIIFTFFYNANLSKLKSFTPIKKFTLFIVACTLIESLLIYIFGLFKIASITQWALFIGIIFILYAMSLGVFEIYKRRAQKEYTILLQEYQHIRSDENVT